MALRTRGLFGRCAEVTMPAGPPIDAAVPVDAAVPDAAPPIDAAVPDPALRGDADLFVVYADSGLRSDVRAGENRGRQLAHEHVVRELVAAGRIDANGRTRAILDIARPREAGNAPMLVAFVQRRSNGDVLQTLRLSLDSCPVP